MDVNHAGKVWPRLLEIRDADDEMNGPGHHRSAYPCDACRGLRPRTANIGKKVAQWLPLPRITPMDFTFSDPRVRHTARLVHALSRDLRRIEQGIGPTIEQMIEAPVLADWLVGSRFEPALLGKVIGHPIVANGPVVTSGLFYLDTERKVARTLSRWYRLQEGSEPQ